MTLTDKLISAISPKWSAQRMAWRYREQMVASYKGGTPTRLSEKWGQQTQFTFGTTADRLAIQNSRDRAYQAYRNNAVARSLVQTETDNVIGDGLNYQPTSSSEAWNREAVDKYYQWLETASVRGGDILTGCELQRTLWDRSRVAGDIGVLLVSQGTESRLQIIPGENIVTPDGRQADQTIYDGIRYDALGRPQTFYILSTGERTGKRDFIPIEARDMVFIAHMHDTNSPRGETCFITTFDLLSQLDRYVDGVALAAWMATVFGILFKQANGAKQLGQLSTELDSQGDSRKAITFENGMVKFIGTDEEVAQVQAHQPMQQTPDFISAMLRLLGQPFDMPLEVIAKDMSHCNFASARIGLLGFYRACRIKAAKFGYRWSRIIKWWLARESHRAPGDPKRWVNAFPEDYYYHELLPNAWDYTDPTTEAQSDLMQMDMLTKSPQMVIHERGRDAERILRDWEEWQKRTDNLPRVHSSMTRHPQLGVGPAGDPLGQEAVEPAGQQAPTQPDPSKEDPPADAVRAYARARQDLLDEMNSNGDE